MFQFNYKLKVAERVKAKCERHPRYNPERDGRGGIKGGCSTCFSLFDLHQARLSLDAAHREFLRRAMPWSHVRQPRNRTNSQKAERSSIWKPTSLIRGVAFATPTLREKRSRWCQKVPLSSRLEGRWYEFRPRKAGGGAFPSPR
jgi:hypothetical protein